MKKLIFLSIILIFSCAKNPQSVQENVLAEIGNRTITKNEFIERAEYTIRPSYAKMDYYQHKKIILNSLIAEKLIAIEEGDSSDLLKNSKFLLFIQGRKEQVMRQLFFQKNMYAKVKLDQKQVEHVYDLAGRTYDIHYISSKNKELSDYLHHEVSPNGDNFEKIILHITDIDSVPRRKVSFKIDEIDQVRQALYEQEIEKGQVIGPLKIEDEYLWIKVLGWIDKVALSPQDMQNRSRDVNYHLTYKYALEKYEKYVHKLMRNKTVQFDKDTFVQLVNILGPIYFPDSDLNEVDIGKTLWQKEGPEGIIADSLSNQLEKMENKTLLTCNELIWTIKDLDRELLLHPLQFRKKHIKRKEFAEQLKLAIVDIIKDKYITRDAYKKGFDKNPITISKEIMWRDAYLAAYYRNNFLSRRGKLSSFENDYMEIIQNDLNPLIEILQEKYNNVIKINTSLFEEIKLTNIDMFALYDNQPYPIVVPLFPLLTTDDQLEYGKKMRN